MKSSKSDGGRNSLVNSAAAPGETGPLFPRLHVSETEKAGPRAPPRNKMALFEQFTVPSNRYMQSSKTSVATSNQQPQFDYRHSYVAYYMPSLAPFSNVVSSCSQPSHGVSSCVTSSVSDQESQRDLRLQTCERSVPLRATAKEDGGFTGSSSLENKARVVSDDVPMQSSLRSHVKETQGVLYTPSVFEKLCDKFASVSSVVAEVPIMTNVRNDSLEAMSITEEVVDYSVSESKGCDQGMKGSMKSTDKLQAKRVTLKSSADACNVLSHGCSKFVSDQSCPQPIIDCDMPEASSLGRNDLAEAALNNVLMTSSDTEDQISSPSGNCLVGYAQSTSTNEPLSASLHVCKDIHDVCPTDGEKVAASAGGFSVNDILNGKRESTGDSQTYQVGSNDLLELSQEVSGMDSDDSPSSVLAIQSFRPKDVIRAVGQQQFWKARKALLRQQRIFSDQVFQLHKLIKVQQLLAETPETLVDEQMPFGSMEHCATSPPQCIAEREQRLDGEAYATDSFKEHRVKDQSTKTANQPKSMENPEWYPAVGNHTLVSSPYLPAFSPGGVSAWGFPSLGMGQWMGSVPAQGKPSAYQPFAGTFPPGTPFSGLYGPVMLGPVPPILPYSIPYTGQRSEPWEEMSSNHGPPVGAGPNLQDVPAVGNVAHDLSGAWQFMQHNNPYYNQRFNANVLERNVSVASGASINSRRPVKPLGIQQTWGEASHSGRLNNHQSESSSPSNASGPKFKSSANMRSTPASRKTDSYHQETEQPAQNIKRSSVFQSFGSSKQHEVSSAGKREEPSRVILRWPKRQQGDQVPESAETGQPFDHSGNALDLFPLVPSLGADCGQSSSKQIREDWQGRVIKAVPHPAVAASQSAAGILLSLQRERQQ